MNDQACWCIVALIFTVSVFGVLILRSLREIAEMLGCPSVGERDTIIHAMSDLLNAAEQPKYDWKTTTTTTKPAKAGKGRKKA